MNMRKLAKSNFKATKKKYYVKFHSTPKNTLPSDFNTVKPLI